MAINWKGAYRLLWRKYTLLESFQNQAAKVYYAEIKRSVAHYVSGKTTWSFNRLTFKKRPRWKRDLKVIALTFLASLILWAFLMSE